MKLLYSSPNALLVNHVRNLLEAADIGVRMKNEFLGGGAGELPPTEAWPELWVKERDFAAAQDLLDDFLHGSEDAPPDWLCPACGERIEGQFSTCWRCGGEKPHNLE